ncbi:MAG TPA: hypothetical protein VKC57_12710, partial [Ktedonobacterales bacterium]|nr:hypothetical protein [Ktedonobacterales bacterium]
MVVFGCLVIEPGGGESTSHLLIAQELGKGSAPRPTERQVHMQDGTVGSLTRLDVAQRPHLHARTHDQQQLAHEVA